MIRRHLAVSLLLGAASGIAVSVGLAAVSGVQLFSPGSGQVAPQSTVGPSLPIASGLGSGFAPTPTREGTTEATPLPTPEPTPPPTPAPIVESVGVMLGLPRQGDTFGVTTPVANLGQYITWRATVGAAHAGKPFDVEFATRLAGRWTGWSKLTSRVADTQGVLEFSWQQRTPAWISVRFSHPAGPSQALQGRWR